MQPYLMGKVENLSARVRSKVSIMVEELTGAEEICEEPLVSRRRLQGTMVSQMRRLG